MIHPTFYLSNCLSIPVDHLAIILSSSRYHLIIVIIFQSSNLSGHTRIHSVMSMAGYILGLGDRHPSNLMLDRVSGRVVHIDFGELVIVHGGYGLYIIVPQMSLMSLHELHPLLFTICHDLFPPTSHHLNVYHPF